MNQKLLLQLAALFLVTQLLGLYVGNHLLATVPPEERPHLVTENPEDVENSVGLFAYILGFTAVLLVVVKFGPEWLVYWIFKGFESLAVFFTSLIVFSVFWDNVAVVALAFGMVAARNIWPKKVWLRNFSSVLATAGAGSVMGISLGVVPVAVFIVLLSVYDFIAVFKTKHMVTLAKAITKKNLSFTYALPTKEHTFELGTGDMVVPLVFSVALLNAFKVGHAYPLYLVPSVAVLVASLAGLLYTVHSASKKVGGALPALPLQGALMLLVWVGFVLAGY